MRAVPSSTAATAATSTTPNSDAPRYLKKSSFGGSSWSSGSKTSSYGGSKYKWSGGSNKFRGYGSGEGGSCDDHCFLGIVVVTSISFLLILIYCYIKYKEGKRKSDTDSIPTEHNWVMTHLNTASKEPCSAPGKYTGLHNQNGVEQLMEPFELSYEPSGIPNQHAVKGKGDDRVGSFVLRGVWKGDRLAMTKQYLRGTGDPNENHGHQVHMRLAKEKTSGMIINDCPRMVGKYYVRTPQYSGEDHMSIWLTEGGAAASDSVEVAAADSTNIPAVMGATVVSSPPVSDAQFVDEEMGGNSRPTPSAPPLQETAPPIASTHAMAGVYVPGQDNGQTYSVGPGMYAHPTGFGAQAVAYRSSRMLAGVTSRISNRNLVQETEVDVPIIKSSGDKMQIKLRGTKIVALPWGVLAESDLKVCDNILSINGEAVLRGSTEVMSKLNKAPVGSVINVTVLRSAS